MLLLTVIVFEVLNSCLWINYCTNVIKSFCDQWPAISKVKSQNRSRAEPNKTWI